MYLSDVIIEPVFTEKASFGFIDSAKNEKGTKGEGVLSLVYVFVVLSSANKFAIAKAVESLFFVKVDAVRVVVVKSKPGAMMKAVRGRRGRKPSYKKAYVTLKKGEKIAMLNA